MPPVGFEPAISAGERPKTERQLGQTHSKDAATPTHQQQRCILTDYFNNYNFSKAQIIRSLLMVIKPKHVGAVLM
jgi:hypothetical protein